jgi:hypothetical protein
MRSIPWPKRHPSTGDAEAMRRKLARELGERRERARVVRFLRGYTSAEGPCPPALVAAIEADQHPR